MSKLLIVDDSALMRREMKDVFEEEGYLLLFARKGQEALDMALQEHPDVIILDINMPVMDGLTCLAHLMDKTSIPVLMFSSLTEKGALVTLEALELGALDYVPKPGGTISSDLSAVRQELKQKVKGALRSRRREQRGKSVSPSPILPPKPPLPSMKGERVRLETLPVTMKGRLKELIIIGASTGGPSTIEGILKEIPPTVTAPIIIAQHMPEKFTRAFAERLDRVCHLKVQEVERMMVVQQGNVYIAQGGTDAMVSQRGGDLMVMSRPVDGAYTWHPSVDRLVQSVMQVCDPSYVLGVLLTGMGDDGAKSMTELKQKGGYTLAESAQTAIIHGMPKELSGRGGACEELPCHEIAGRIRQLCI